MSTQAPISIVITDSVGNAMTVDNATKGAFTRAPYSAVITDKDGYALIPTGGNLTASVSLSASQMAHMNSAPSSSWPPLPADTGSSRWTS